MRWSTVADAVAGAEQLELDYGVEVVSGTEHGAKATIHASIYRCPGCDAEGCSPCR